MKDVRGAPAFLRDAVRLLVAEEQVIDQGCKVLEIKILVIVGADFR